MGFTGIVADAVDVVGRLFAAATLSSGEETKSAPAEGALLRHRTAWASEYARSRRRNDDLEFTGSSRSRSRSSWESCRGLLEGLFMTMTMKERPDLQVSVGARENW